MGSVQIVTTVLAVLVTLAAVVLVVRAVRRMVRLIRAGQPDHTRGEHKALRARVMLTEIFGHTRMLKWSVVGVAHWFVMVAFLALSVLVLEAYFEVVDPAGHFPLVGHWTPYGLATEWIGAFGTVGILVLITIRLRNRPNRTGGRSRFTGSTMWQGYFVEYVVLTVLLCGFTIRGFKVATGQFEHPAWATPFSHAVGAVLPASEAGISIAALLKIGISMMWVIVIALNVTMGVAWHRFAAFFNIFFKRDPGKRAGSGLGAIKPLTSNGKPLDFEQADPERDQFGVARVEQFTWKGLLDFTTCTECGRCQSQCPAWNTGKPLSPKLLVLSLRDHAYAKAPYLLAGGGKDAEGEEKGAPDAPSQSGRLAKVNALALAEAERPLIGGPTDRGVIDPDVLWSCTTCGACVEQCPVDIEHVDHIVDMRRYQVLIESSFPPEAAVMLRNLENKGNPWGAPPNTREDWTKGLDFEVPRVGEGDDDFEYLFWVGCAGAFEDRAKKTTRAVATLLHEAGVKFAILGERETCTGDPARRIGNEFVFQMLAQQNVETLNEALGDREPAKRKIVATCPHCFNSIGNEYAQLGGESDPPAAPFEVVHHTQLLAHLVATGKLTPVQPIDGGVTYHDPCYLGRHNRVFSPPREVLGAALEGAGVTAGSAANGGAAAANGGAAAANGGAAAGNGGAAFTEMPRHRERSFCCGAGGARMWMEERIGKRINTERVEEALSTGAKTLAVGCPFCFTMLSDGVTGKAADDQMEVVDVASVLLRSVRPST